MATLHFKGPFHINHLPNLNLKGKVGIYIWGFMFEYDNVKREIKKPINLFNNNIPPYLLYNNNEVVGVDYIAQNWIYIPYYVGETNNLENRINEHHDIQNGDRWKYTRLTSDAYKSFFYGGQFPVLRSDLSKRISRRKHDSQIKEYIVNYSDLFSSTPIEYFNSGIILNEIYNLRNGILNSNKIVNNGITVINLSNNWPYNVQKDSTGITDLIGSNLISIDTLNQLIDPKLNNNFWFCFAELDQTDIYEYSKAVKIKKGRNFLEIPEAQTFYSLKGVTISETLNYNTILSSHFKYSITPEFTCKDIFLKDSLGNVIHDPIIFPGYIF